MGGMGPLAPDQRFVVTIEIPGAKSAQDTEKINAIIASLKQQFNATVKLSITGSK
jgi:hypothetical protein